MRACTISGSFNHYYDEVSTFHTKIKQKNIFNILSPRDMTIRDQSTDFMLLKSDVSDNIKNIEESHLDAISISNMLFVVNPKNYIGLSTAFEIGFAKARNIPISYLEQTKHKLNKEIKFKSFGLKNKIILFFKNNNISYFNNLIDDLERKYNIRIILLDGYNINREKNLNFSLIDNKNGKISVEDAYKMGFSYANNIPIILTEEPSDILFNQMAISKKEIKKITNFNYDFNIISKQTNSFDIFIHTFLNKYKSILKFI